MNFATALHYVNQLAKEFPWEVIVASGILSPVMAGVIKLVKAQKDITKLGLVFLGGTLVAAGHYLTTTPSQDPTIIVLQGAILAFTAQPFYYLVVKPGIAYISAEVAKAVALNEKKAAVLPPALAADPTEF